MRGFHTEKRVALQQREVLLCRSDAPFAWITCPAFLPPS